MVMEWNKITCDNKTGFVEGLPEEEGNYIFSFGDGSVEICELCQDCDGWFLDRGDDFSRVKAWMPVPEPYKEGGNNEEGK